MYKIPTTVSLCRYSNPDFLVFKHPLAGSTHSAVLDMDLFYSVAGGQRDMGNNALTFQNIQCKGWRLLQINDSSAVLKAPPELDNILVRQPLLAVSAIMFHGPLEDQSIFFIQEDTGVYYVVCESMLHMPDMKKMLSKDDSLKASEINLGHVGQIVRTVYKGKPVTGLICEEKEQAIILMSNYRADEPHIYWEFTDKSISTRGAAEFHQRVKTETKGYGTPEALHSFKIKSIEEVIVQSDLLRSEHLVDLCKIQPITLPLAMPIRGAGSNNRLQEVLNGLRSRHINIPSVLSQCFVYEREDFVNFKVVKDTVKAIDLSTLCVDDTEKVVTLAEEYERLCVRTFYQNLYTPNTQLYGLELQISCVRNQLEIDVIFFRLENYSKRSISLWSRKTKSPQEALEVLTAICHLNKANVVVQELNGIVSWVNIRTAASSLSG